MVKFRFALDCNGLLTDVTQLHRRDIPPGTVYYSIDSKQELIPRLGNVRTNHFALKNIVSHSGSEETYLHCLGKKIFFDTYEDCRTKGLPFILKYYKRRICNRLEPKYGISCELPQEQDNFDLISYFDEIIMEKRDGNFIPDLLLRSSETGNKIFIEIAVTHFSSPEKLASQNRIIEIIVRNEDDALQIQELPKGLNQGNVHLHNFIRKSSVGTFCEQGKCCNEFFYFNVNNKGKCNLNIATENDIDDIIEKYKSTSVWSIIELKRRLSQEEYFFVGSSIKQQYVNYIIAAYKKGIQVRNCFICRYGTENRSWDFEEGNPVFCKFLKIGCSSTKAASCNYFRANV